MKTIHSLTGPKSKGGAGQPSGYVGGNKTIQVFLNGKIVTPHSLAPQKGQSVASRSKPMVYRSSLTPANEEDMVAVGTKKKEENKQKYAHSIGKKEEEFTSVILTETATESLFFLPSLVASTDMKDIGEVEERNKKYLELIESHKNPDGFTGRSTQTINDTTKNQNEMTDSMTQKDSGCQATSFDIIDSNMQLRDRDAAEADILSNRDSSNMDKAGLSASVKKFVDTTVGVSLNAAGCLLDTSYVKPVEGSGSSKKSKTKAASSASKADITESKVITSDMNVGGGPSQSEVTGEQIMGNINVSGAASGANVTGAASTSNIGEMSTGDQAAGGNGADVQDINDILREREAEKIMSSELLLSRILMLERAVQQNVYHRQHLECRDLPDIEPLVLLTQDDRVKKEGGDKAAGGGFGFGAGAGIGIGAIPTSPGSIESESKEAGSQSLEVLEDEEEGSRKVMKLFSFFYAPLVQGRAVTAMAWNSVNTDILAVSYGRVDFNLEANAHKLGTPVDEELQGGLVLFWSLRNPEYPEKILRTKQPVTALDFSRFSPMLLAVGCYNGDVMVFDVKREGADWNKPKESSTSIPGGHVEPVWQIKWVSKGADRLENVVSISTDGEVLQWDLKKGLSVQNLMSLKRGGLGDGWISRQAAGLTFDFMPGDPTTYFVGTEEGGVHKCSVSYNEQYMETYEGHKGPVYRLRCSSRWPNIFLSCSSDWSLKLFHVRNKKSVLTMRCGDCDEAITDTVWCPGNATVFASVTESGHLHIWDLSVSSIEPIVNYDTSVDVVDTTSEEEPTVTGGEGEDVAELDGFAAMQAARREFGRQQENDGSKESPVARLLKNLAQAKNNSSSKEKKTDTKKRRSLTSVLFSEQSPITVVGDVNGAVTLYRVIDPVTVLLEGPLQQVQRLKSSIFSQADPGDATKLISYEDSGERCEISQSD